MDLEVFLDKYKDPKEGQVWAGSLGVYVISPKCPAGFSRLEQCDEFPKKVKLGKTLGQRGFKGRLSTYSTYWPLGLRVWSILRVDSYDPKFHVYRDLATDRETALKQSTERFRGFEKYRKGSQSEWVRLEPEKMLRHMLAVARPRDEVFSCIGDECRSVKPRGTPGVPLGRRGVAAADAPQLKLGDPGMPRVKTRRYIRVAGDINHPEQAGMLAKLQAQKADLDQKRATLALKADSPERRRQRRVLDAAARRVSSRLGPRDLRALRPNRGYLGPTGVGSPVRRTQRRQAGQARGAAGVARSPTQLARQLRAQGRTERAIANNEKERGLDYERKRERSRSWATADLEPPRRSFRTRLRPRKDRKARQS